MPLPGLSQEANKRWNTLRRNFYQQLEAVLAIARVLHADKFRGMTFLGDFPEKTAE
jgi:hypothetical protein